MTGLIVSWFTRDKRARGFTLIELLVVIAIITLLAAILFPVFSRAKEAAKASSCLSNESQIAIATSLYVQDYDGAYPQTKDPSDHPEIDDASGALEEPDFGSYFEFLSTYIRTGNFLTCPSDPDPKGGVCRSYSPDTPELTSYLVNGFLVFGANESDIAKPALFITYTERRSRGTADAGPFCDTIYRPWYSTSNASAPEDQMNGESGAVSTIRHAGGSNFAFADGHVKAMRWEQTLSPGLTSNMHWPH